MSVEVTVLPNGLRVVTDRMDSVETIAVGAWVAAGTRHETADVNGISHLLEHMAFKGTARRTAQGIAEEMDNVGGQLNAYTSRDHTAYFAKVLKEDTGLAVDILSDILLNSTMDSEELAREQHVVVQEIYQADDTPDDIIFDHFQATAYPDQPMGWPVLGSEGIVRSITSERLRRYMSDNYAADTMVISAAGNVDHDKFVRMVESTFAALPTRAKISELPSHYNGGDFRQQPGVAAGALMQAGQLEFLVRAMHLVVIQPEADKQTVEAEDTLQALDHRDGATAAHQHRGLSVFCGQRPSRGLHPAAIGRDLDAWGGAEKLHLQLAIRRQAIGDEAADPLNHLRRVLPGDQPAGQLGMGFCGDDCLAAGAGIAAPDTVEVGGRPRPETLQRAASALTDRLDEADFAKEGCLVEAKAVPFHALRVAKLLHAVIEAGDLDAAVLVVQRAEDLCEQVDDVAGRATIEAGMQVPPGGAQIDLAIDHAAQLGGDRRRRDVPHAGITDHRDIGGKFGPVRGQESIEAR